MNFELRPWQINAIKKSTEWFDKKNDKRFLINAAPGAGKTICASMIAKKLLDEKKIERVIVIAPRREVVKQWSEEFKAVTGRTMMRYTGEIDDYDFDVCSTWSAVENLLDGFQAICQKYKTLIICDEHHHAAVSAAWGISANKAFENSKYVLVLTGTPIRSDGKSPVWFYYSNETGSLTHPQDGTYTLTYGEAVEAGYCRPVFFHRHEGNFKVVLDNEIIAVSGDKGVKVDEKKHPKKLLKSIQKSLDFYTLARKISDERKIDLNCYQATMLKWGIEKLDEARKRIPNAGGLVIAPSIKVAEYMSKILFKLTGEKPILVHSDDSNSEDKISAFRNSNKKWIVSVAMISEGVDIKRLRLLVYLPNPQTELSFRQAIGRVVRSTDNDDDSSAYVIMPRHKIFEEYADRVEVEMKPFFNSEKMKQDFKKCPKCENECKVDENVCSECSFEFPVKKTIYKNCDKCDALNTLGAKNCQKCGESFEITYRIDLESALRDGGIARGVEIDEKEVQLSEKYYEKLRKDILESGDAGMINLLKKHPKELLAKFSLYTSKYYKE